MRNLVRRYVTVEQRKAENQGVTEDDVNEIKQDISAFRCELVEILKNSGMNTSTAATTGQGIPPRGSKLSCESPVCINVTYPVPLSYFFLSDLPPLSTSSFLVFQSVFFDCFLLSGCLLTLPLPCPAASSPCYLCVTCP